MYLRQRVRKLATAGLFALAVVLTGSRARAADAPAREGVEFFETKIRPVLEERCFNCHSAKAKKLRGKLRLDSFDAMVKGGDSGKPSITPSDADKSLLIEAIRYAQKGDDALLMPPPKDDK